MAPTATVAARPTPAPPAAAPPGRWSSLDALRGLALCMMVTHHFAEWAGGRVRARFVGFQDLAVTDLAAPAFTVAVGAAAWLVGTQVRSAAGFDAGRAGRAARRWGEVLALGLAIDVAVGGGIDGGGVLPSLAALGVVVTAASAAGLRSPWPWWGLAGLCGLASHPLTDGAAPQGLWAELATGSFSIVTYGTFAAAGAALAAHATPAGERALPLGRAAAGVGLAALVASIAVPAATAAPGLWPPARHHGDLAYTAWGLLATFAVWAGLRWAARRRWAATTALARAGQRTLLVFGLHYAVKIAMQHLGLLGTLDTRAWGWAVWAATVLVWALAMWPARRRRRPATTPPGVPVHRRPSQDGYGFVSDETIRG